MKSDAPILPFDPFAARAVGDPWRSPEPDVKSINARPFQAVLRLLGQMNKTQQVAALLLGDAGSGKTHLIKRLMNEQDLKLIFVYVHPIKDDRTMFSSLLERVMTNLDCIPFGQQASSGLSQLDLIARNVIVATIEDYSKQAPGKVSAQTLKAIARDPSRVFQFKLRRATWDKVLTKSEEFLAKRLSADLMSKMVIKCLFQYLDESKKDAVRVFLSGYIPDDDDAKRLGLTFHDIDFSVEAQEKRSKQILKAIGRLLSFYRPMVLCFDQLENLDTPSLVNSFGKLISEIVNEIDNILPVGFMRPDTLESSFSEDKCDKAALDRLKSNVFPLEGCNLEQALEMIKARLEWAFEGSSHTRPNSFYPFQEDVLRREILKDGNSPRSVLTRASKLMGSKFIPEDAVTTVKECFRSEREQLIADPKKEPFAKDTVLEALSLYFGNRGKSAQYEVLGVGHDGNIVLSLTVKLRTDETETRTLAIAAEAATHGRTLIKNLGKLISRIEGREADIAIFLRDARNPIPPSPGKMPKTTEQLNKFEKCGGTKLYIDYNHLADLYALVYTRNKIPSGDLSYISNDVGDRNTVTMADFASFVTSEFESPFLNEIENRLLTGKTTRLKRPPSLTLEQLDGIVERIQKVLGRPPYKFKLEHIASNLQKQKDAPEFTLDQLTKVISQHSDVIGYYAVTPPIYFLKK